MKNTDRSVPLRGAAGFTLIELLIAMVLFSVGLLALQGLSVVAVRSVGLAERNTRAAEAAAQWLEDARGIILLNERPRAFACTVPGLGQITRVVNVANPQLPHVTVTVTPDARGGTPRPYAVTTLIHRDTDLPNTTSNAPIPQGCP